VTFKLIKLEELTLVPNKKSLIAYDLFWGRGYKLVLWHLDI